MGGIYLLVVFSQSGSAVKGLPYFFHRSTETNLWPELKYVKIMRDKNNNCYNVSNNFSKSY